VKAKDDAGHAVTARLAGVTEAGRKSNHNPLNEAVLASVAKLNWSRENAAIRFHKDPQIAEIRLKYFIGNTFPQWVEQTFKSLKEKRARTLILDLRRNGGGTDQYGALLVSYLTDKPFRYFDRINVKTIAPSALFKSHSDWKVEFESKLRAGTVVSPSGGYFVTSILHPGVVEQSPGKYPFLGKVVCIDRRRDILNCCRFLRGHAPSKTCNLIGEETGGGYLWKQLRARTESDPRALEAACKTADVRILERSSRGTMPHAEAAIPDHTVETTASNLLRGIDAQLDLALQLAQATPPSN